MKTIIKGLPCFLLLIAVIAVRPGVAQVAYSHTLTEPGYAGLKFRYKVSLRTQNVNQRGLGLMVDIPKMEMEEHHHDMAPPSARKFLQESPEWTDVILEGTLSVSYAEINLVVIPMGMGDFYMDDLSFQVLTPDSLWKTIYQTGFEDGMAGWNQGMGKARKFTNSLFTSMLSDDNPKSGKHSLLISGKLVVDYSDEGKHDWAIDATYGESCSCESVCPCISGSGAMPAACIGNNVIVIHSGHYDNVNLDGLKIMTAFSLLNWSKIYIDEHATAEQKDALLKLLWKIPMVKGYLTQQKGTIERAPILVVETDSSFAYSAPNSYAKINYIFPEVDSILSLNNLEPDNILSHNKLGLSEKNVHTGDKYAFEYHQKNGVVAYFKASSEDENYRDK